MVFGPNLAASGRPRSKWIAPVVGGVLLALVGCGPAAGSDPSAGAAPNPQSGHPETTFNGPANATEGIQLTSDRNRYRPEEPMRLRFHNGSPAEVQLSGSLGGLRGWRLVGDRREPWDHSLMETTALVPVPPGETVELGPVRAPQQPGRYQLEVHYYGPSGQAAATVDIHVEEK